ncbi:hypothetical protein TanjilG_32816 [Lupinus angustifolius]|uniref:Uncharacterized protein n=1 Tax=Lupinus angustifolius TaxID=3871 RepID=A0A4P1RFT5_LUPAN|nr:hypothetical protein TanjilG_32816 [Lupinus angustifolius]
MEGAELELERRSNFLKGLIQKKKSIEQKEEKHENLHMNNISVRACDMPIPLQNRAFSFARDILHSMPPNKLDSKHLALALKKEFPKSNIAIDAGESDIEKFQFKEHNCDI